MRWSNLSRAVTLALLSVAYASQSPAVVRRAEIEEVPSEDVEKDAWGNPVHTTTFNERSVPPMKDLDGEKFSEISAEGNW